METSWFVEIRDEELIKFVEEQENPNTKRKPVYYVELFNNFIQTSNAGLLSSPTCLQQLSPQLLNDHLWRWKKKMAPTMNPRVSEDFFQASTDIQRQNYRFTIFTRTLCLKLKQNGMLRVNVSQFSDDIRVLSLYQGSTCLLYISIYKDFISGLFV